MSTSTAEASTSNSTSGSNKPKTLSGETGQNKLRPWKSARNASTNNVQKSNAPKVVGSGWAARQSERQKEQAIKALEKSVHLFVSPSSCGFGAGGGCREHLD